MLAVTVDAGIIPDTVDRCAPTSTAITASYQVAWDHRPATTWMSCCQNPSCWHVYMPFYMHMYIELTYLATCINFPPVPNWLSMAQVITLFHSVVEVYCFYIVACNTHVMYSGTCCRPQVLQLLTLRKYVSCCMSLNNFVAVTDSTHPNLLENAFVCLWESGHQQEQQAHLIFTLDCPVLYQHLLSN